MMSQLLRTSIFCNDVTPDDAIDRNGIWQTFMYNTTELQTSLATPFSFSSRGPCANIPKGGFQTCAEDTQQQPTAIQDEFWSRHVKEAKVSLRSFTCLSEAEVFMNNYLSPLTEFTNIDNLCSSTDDKPRFRSYGSSIPFPYAGLIATAIYVSGKKALTAGEIYAEILKLLPDLDLDKKYMRNNIRRALSKNCMFYNYDHIQPTMYSIREEKVHAKFFCRRRSSKVTAEKYSSTIPAHFNLNNLLQDLSKGQRMRRDGGNDVISVHFGNGVNIRKRSSNKSEEVLAMTPRLELPDRPCFRYSDSDSDSDILIFEP